jgi:hypothetical protein
MFQSMVRIHDLDGLGIAAPAHILQPGGAIDEQHHLERKAQAAPDGILAQTGTKLINRAEARYVVSRLVIADRVPGVIALMLGEYTAQIGHARFGRTIGLFARATLELFLAHRHTGGVTADIHHRHCAATGLGLSFLPLLGRGSHALHHPLDLPSRNVDPNCFC